MLDTFFLSDVEYVIRSIIFNNIHMKIIMTYPTI